MCTLIVKNGKFVKVICHMGVFPNVPDSMMVQGSNVQHLGSKVLEKEHSKYVGVQAVKCWIIFLPNSSLNCYLFFASLFKYVFKMSYCSNLYATEYSIP